TEECFGGGEHGQGYYKKEVQQHKNRERVGEAGALAAGAFSLYEGYEAKKDPAHARKHQIEAGLAGVAAAGAGGYAYHEHREQKQPSYGGKQVYRMPVHNSYCN
uniref:Abscisic stress ripening n=1 Tax=Aegilops tauschii subsp. strangulata TaxID=200361 RepID=A0A453GTA8_AEGTS